MAAAGSASSNCCVENGVWPPNSSPGLCLVANLSHKPLGWGKLWGLQPVHLQSRAGEGEPVLHLPGTAQVWGYAIPFHLSRAMLFSTSQGMCLLYTSPPLCSEQPVPAWQGMFLLQVFYLIPTTQRPVPKKYHRAESVCGDVKACPEPSKYRCAKGRLCSPRARQLLSWGCPKQGLSTWLEGVQGLSDGSVPIFPGCEHVPVQLWVRQEGFVSPSPAALDTGVDLPVAD